MMRNIVTILQDVGNCFTAAGPLRWLSDVCVVYYSLKTFSLPIIFTDCAYKGN